MSDRDRRFLNRMGWGLWFASGIFISWGLSLDAAHHIAFVFGLALAIAACQIWWEIEK